ncbi:MAG: hypothetical protein ACFFG0_18890, partial [Candidatus Thorarchaeota archaeon]
MKLKKALIDSNNNATLFEMKMDKIIKSVQDEQQSKRPAKTFHASSLVVESHNFCPKQKILEYINQSKKDSLTYGTRRVFFNGNVHHDKWQNLFRYANIDEKIEVTHYSKQYHLTGTPDAIIWFMNKLYVCEIKTMNHFLFTKLKTVPLNALIQANIYMHLTSIPRAIVLVDNKNDHNIKTFWLSYRPEIIYKYLSQHEIVM